MNQVRDYQVKAYKVTPKSLLGITLSLIMGTLSSLAFAMVVAQLPIKLEVSSAISELSSSLKFDPSFTQLLDEYTGLDPDLDSSQDSDQSSVHRILLTLRHYHAA